MFRNKGKVLRLNGDDIDVQDLFCDITSTRLRGLCAGYRMVFIDEAQQVKDVGLRLKNVYEGRMDIRRGVAIEWEAPLMRHFTVQLRRLGE